MNKEIRLPVAELKQALPGLTKVISKGRTLPVLHSILIQRNREGIVTLQATDLDSFVTYELEGPQEKSQADVLVPADQLTKAIKASSPKSDVGIISQQQEKVILRYNIAGNQVEQTISTLPVQEWPQAPKITGPAVDLEPEFGKALKEALECTSDDSSREVLKGACLDVTDNKFHYVVGSDGKSLFSANSFCFTLEKSVIIPASKFLDWSDFLDENPAFLSVEPGKQAESKKEGSPETQPLPGWIKLQSPRWTYITREIAGQFPNWKQCVPEVSKNWTHATLSEEAVKQLLQVIPNLPGSNQTSHPVRLQIDRQLIVEGRNQVNESWTSVPITGVEVTGKPSIVALDREYLLKALRFGLNKLEVKDALTPVVFSKGGKRMVVMPVRLDDTTQPHQEEPPSATPTTTHTEKPATEERTEMPKAATAEENHPTNVSAVKSLVEHVDQIKENLKSAIRDLNTFVDALKQAEKEKRSTEKEIESIRAKLRQIQSVAI